MSRIAIPTRDESPVASMLILDEIDRKFGTIPNLFRLMGISPDVLQGYVGLNGALARAFDLKTREQIAVAVAAVNGCDYCLSAHSYLGVNLAGLAPTDLALNRKGSASDPKTAAIVHFASIVAGKRGQLANADIEVVRGAGLKDAQIIEIVALVAENFFTNFLNNVFQTTIDFPVVRVSEAA